MGTEDKCNMGLQQGGGDSRILNCSSSGMNINPASSKVAAMPVSSESTFKTPNGLDPFYGSGWDPLVSLNQREDYRGSSIIHHNQFASSHYSVALENTVGSSSHLVHYASDSGLIDMVPKMPCLGSESFSEMVNPFGLPECGKIADTICNPNYIQRKSVGNENVFANSAHSHETCQISEEGVMGSSPSGKRKRASDSHSPLNPSKKVEEEQSKDQSANDSESSKEQDDQKQKTEENVSSTLRGKQTGKQNKDNSPNGEPPKENYVHVRAKRGQATNSHSLAERVRRERISERMRLLQELVPGCNKITGKAVMLDEIINYVQSLQQQVEFLSMKLATVNPELNIDIGRILSKDILHSQSSNAAILGLSPGLTPSHPFPGITQGAFPVIPNTTQPFHPLPQNMWDNDFQNILQMGFDSNTSISNLGPNGRSSKLEL